MRVGYLTNCFGTQSHTFIRNEILGLESLGLDIKLYGIREDEHIAPEAAEIVQKTRYLYPLAFFETLFCNLYFLCRSPVNYARGAVRAITSEEFGASRRIKMLFHYLVSARIARIMQKQGVTLIHSHFMNVSTSIAMYASHHSGIPYSVTIHSAGTYRTPHILGMHQKLREAQFLIMISHYNIAYCQAIEPCAHKSQVIRCGMDLNMFRFEPKQTIGAVPQILGVGRFVQKKGFIYLIEAAGLLMEEGFEFRLKLIGDGPLVEQLKDKVLSLGLAEVIEFAGQQGSDVVSDSMRKSDIVVIPSVTSDSGEKEGLPVVIMEAMATGIPVIASDHSAIGEIVQQGVTGHLVAEKDVQGIAEAIKQICANPNAETISSGHKLVNTDFEIGIVAKQRFDLFKAYAKKASN